MIALDALLDRPGLDRALRLLAYAKARIATGDWPALERACARARIEGVPRAALEETLLQGVLFFGFPRIVTSFEVLCRAWPADTAPRGGGLPRAEWNDAGRRLFDAIYDRNADAVHAMLRGYHAELHDFVLESAYGRVLSRPGLDPERRELLAVAALAALDQIPQLVAHARGARRFGASEDEVREVLVTALGEASSVDQLVRRIGG